MSLYFVDILSVFESIKRQSEEERFMKEQYEIDQFLMQVGAIESKVYNLLQQSNLSDEEKNFILNHILVVPGYKEEVLAKNCAS